jgi:hypothetical protein
MEMVRELFQFMSVRRKFWLMPILVMVSIFGTLVMLTQGSAIAPFVYALF